MILLSHPTGNSNVRAVLDALQRHSLLFGFHTTIGLGRDEGNWIRWPRTLRQELERRVYDVPRGTITRYPQRELVRQLAGKTAWKRVLQRETGWACVDAVYHDLDRRVARFLLSHSCEPQSAQDASREEGALSGVYAYEDGALHTFKAARGLGLNCFYDLPIAHWSAIRKLLGEEAERWPEWIGTMPGTNESPEKGDRKDLELELCDTVMVPSTFVRDSLPPSIRGTKKVVLGKFGSPQMLDEQRVARVETPDRPLRVLFVGSLTQRKGLADLFAAMKLLGRSDIELHVMGSPVLELEFYRRQYAHFHYEAPRPHSQVLHLMQCCDVFVLPSIVEGRALVQQEALACGLPLIVTPNAGGEDLIEEGQTGFLVPIRSPQNIADRLEWFAVHREELPAMREAARRKASQYTWREYGDTVVRGIKDEPA